MTTLFALTLSGSALALLLFVLRLLFRKKIPNTVYYYAWLLVLLRFMLPLPGLIRTGDAERTETPKPAAVITSVPVEYEETVFVREIEPAAKSPAGEVSPVVVQETETPAPDEAAQAAKPAASIDWRSPVLWLSLWASGAAVCFLVTVISYARFSIRLSGSLEKPDVFIRTLYASIPGHKPALYGSPVVKTPMMCGVFHPRIILPVQCGDEETLLNILRHELMHYRRRDTLYKWFSVAVLSLQWFNPLSWLIRREIDRACELSCDEMLLQSMDRAEKQSYGNTLLNMAASSSLPAGVVATTFSTEKKNLKERLEQIMHYKKGGARTLAAVLALVLLAGCGVVAGPAMTSSPKEPELPEETRDVVKVSSMDELLAAIGPDTVIELAAGEYDLSTASNYGKDSHSSYYSWNEVWGEEGQTNAELVIHNVDGLTLRGAGLEETTIAAVPRYANVIRFINCRDLEVADLTAGHTMEPGFCSGGVLRLESCGDVSVTGCGLYGCGTIGVDAMDTVALKVFGCHIYECSYEAVNLSTCRDVRIENCSVYRHGTREGTGGANALFAAYYSDGVVISSNDIYENAAQGVLNLSYTKNAAFVSNSVYDNRFDGAVFMLSSYAPVVDGCAFHDNGQIRQWVQSDGFYPYDISGKNLDKADFESMTLREIDPDTAVKPAPAAAATEVRPGGSIEVTTVDEFLAAIGPDRTIILNGDLFDLSTASNYGSSGGEYYYWNTCFDGPELVIRDVDGLSIRALAKDPKTTVIAAIPRYANVLSFQNCENLSLSGFTAGHTKEPGSCSGGVLYFQYCGNVEVHSMSLYGCGILGIQASNCWTVSVLRTEIYECSQGAAQFYQTDGIRLESCDIHDVPSPALRFTECGDKSWNNEPLNGLRGEYDVDENGRIIPASVGGQIDAEYIYDENGRLSILREKLPIAGTRETRYYYSENGLCIRIENWLDGELVSTTAYEEFDDQLKPLRRSTYNAQNKLLSYQLYEYDYEAHTQRIETYNSDGTFLSYCIYTYNEDWSTIVSFYDQDGILHDITMPAPQTP